MTTWTKIRRLAGFCGRNVSMLFVLSVPLSLLQGGNEILFGLGLMMFLSSYGLVTGATLPTWFPTSAHPFVVLIVLGFTRWIFSFIFQFINQLSYESFQGRVRRKVAAAVEIQSAGASLTVSEVSNVFTNIAPKSSAFVSAALQGFGNVMLLIVTIVGMLRLSGKLTLVSAVLAVVLGFPLFLSRKMFQSYSGAVYKSSGAFISRLTRDIRNLSFLNIIGRTGDETAGLLAVSWNILSAYIRYTFWITANSTWPQFAAVCVIAIVVYINHHMGLVMASRLVPFVYLLSRVTNSAGEAVRCLGTVQFNQPFVSHLLELTDKINPAQNAFYRGTRKIGEQGVRSIECMGLTIGREHALVENIAFSARSGEFISISGESGKGKSTLILTLIGLVPPLKGEVLWNGTSLTEIDLFDLKDRCAFSGPDPFLLDASIRDNVLFGNERLNPSDAEIREALSLAKCDFVDALPKNLEARLQEGGEGVSAGQKQRLSIARAILRKPDVLILDEATANLDVETEAAIMTNLRAKLPNVIILAVSHRGSIAQFATSRLSL